MDKQLTFIFIGFLALFVCLITWATFKTRYYHCRWIAIGYTAFMWLCIIAMTVITFLYK